MRRGGKRLVAMRTPSSNRHQYTRASNCRLSFSVVFFFSSRRRHTRFDCDWSSDVCSSDLSCGEDRASCFGLLRALRDEVREAAALHHLAALVDDLALLDDDAGVAHRPLRHDPRPAHDRVADANGAQHLPVEAHEREHDQRRLRHPPAQSRREAERQDVRDRAAVGGELAREPEVDRHVGRRDGQARRLLDVLQRDVLEVGARHGRGRRSIIRSVSPSWTTSPRWLSTLRCTVTRPRSGLGVSFLPMTFARRRIVSPILIGPLNFHRSPTNASVAYAWVARVKRPAWIARPRRPWAIRSPKIDCFMSSASVWSTL